jgi:outer membrane protein, heavy metal efflux system
MEKYFLPLALAAWCFIPTYAQTLDPPKGHATHEAAQRNSEPLGLVTLPMALAWALRANPELAAAGREIEAAEGAARQAGALPNPEFAMSVEDAKKATRTTTLQLNQPVELGGKRSARLAVANRDLEATLIDLVAKRADIRATVIAAFYETLTAQERHQLAIASAELAQRATAAAAKRVIAGKLSPVDETKARIAESGVRMELAQAASELSNARRRLATTWGGATPRFERVEALASPATVPSLEDLAQRLQQAPVLVRARLEVDRRLALTDVERSRQVPDITVSVGAKREEELGRNQAIVGVSIPIPLFDRNQGNLQEALRRADKARDELAATEVRLGSELAQAQARLTAAQAEAALLRQDILPSAQSAYDAAAKGFELGKFGFFDVLDAQRTLFQSQSQYLRAQSEAHRASADIERIVGAVTP